MKLETAFQVCNLYCQFGPPVSVEGPAKPLLAMKELALEPLRDVGTTLVQAAGVPASGAGVAAGGPGLGCGCVLRGPRRLARVGRCALGCWCLSRAWLLGLPGPPQSMAGTRCHVSPLGAETLGWTRQESWQRLAAAAMTHILRSTPAPVRTVRTLPRNRSGCSNVCVCAHSTFPFTQRSVLLFLM